MSNNIVLDVKNVRKKIGTHVIISDVSFKIYAGDILGFIGKNGAGKTTTIKLILGLQNLCGGTVKINGYDLKKNFVAAISNVGAIVENPDLYMYMSGYENLKISAKLYGVSETRILEVVELVGLKEKIYEKVKKYSLGMRQRLGIAQAIIHKPSLLILDEPMNGLDPTGIKEFKNLLKKLATEEKMAVLISSHLLSELENICNRICILSDGRIIQDKEINEIKKITKQTNYILELSSIKLQNILYDYTIIDEHHIKINTNKEKIQNILKTLLLNDINVYELTKEKVTLENLFLNTIKENTND